MCRRAPSLLGVISGLLKSKPTGKWLRLARQQHIFASRQLEPFCFNKPSIKTLSIYRQGKVKEVANIDNSKEKRGVDLYPKLWFFKKARGRIVCLSFLSPTSSASVKERNATRFKVLKREQRRVLVCLVRLRNKNLSSQGRWCACVV